MKLCFLLLITVAIYSSLAMSMPGSVGQAKPADAAVNEVVNQVRGDIETKTGKTYTTFNVVSYATQVCVDECEGYGKRSKSQR
jgi:hypothetical protein